MENEDKKLQHRSGQAWFHVGRVAGGDRHHRDLGGDDFTGVG